MLTWRAMIAVGLVLAASAGRGEDAVTASATPTAAPRLQPPRLRAEAIGPTQVRLTAETAPGDTPYVYGVMADGVDADGRKYRAGFAGRSYEATQWTAVDGVPAGAIVRYRAYAMSGVAAARSRSDWSNEVRVQMPPPPAAAPAAPSNLTGRPAGPFRIALAWRDRSDNEYGFEVRKRVGEQWVRVVVVGPDTTAVTLHGRPPSTAATYRVRAFNVRGPSADAHDVVVRTEALTDTPPVTPDGMQRPTPGPCRPRAEVLRELQASGDEEAGTASGEAPIRVEDLGGAMNLVAFTHPVFCGSNCSWMIYSGDEDCLRLRGYGSGAGLLLVTTTPSGLPVLMDVGHGSASYAGAALMQLVDGWFSNVDSYGHCSEDSDEITALSPPFSSCQQDDDLWWGLEDH